MVSASIWGGGGVVAGEKRKERAPHRKTKRGEAEDTFDVWVSHTRHNGHGSGSHGTRGQWRAPMSDVQRRWTLFEIFKPRSSSSSASEPTTSPLHIQCAATCDSLALAGHRLLRARCDSFCSLRISYLPLLPCILTAYSTCAHVPLRLRRLATRSPRLVSADLGVLPVLLDGVFERSRGRWSRGQVAPCQVAPPSPSPRAALASVSRSTTHALAAGRIQALAFLPNA